jgi:hypothetical protein
VYFVVDNHYLWPSLSSYAPTRDVFVFVMLMSFE